MQMAEGPESFGAKNFPTVSICRSSKLLGITHEFICVCYVISQYLSIFKSSYSKQLGIGLNLLGSDFARRATTWLPDLAECAKGAQGRRPSVPLDELLMILN